MGLIFKHLTPSMAVAQRDSQQILTTNLSGKMLVNSLKFPGVRSKVRRIDPFRSIEYSLIFSLIASRLKKKKLANQTA